MDTETPTKADPPQEQAPEPAGRQLGVALVGVFCSLVGYLCGWQLVIPLALVFGVGWLLKRIPGSPTAFRIAWALMAGRALYLAADMVMGGGWFPDAIHILVLGAGLAWLWVRPGLGPVILLGLYEIATVVLIVIAYARAQMGSWQERFLVAHFSLQGAAVLALISGYIKTRRRLAQSLAAQPGSLPPPLP